jgi:hypothetical protein
MSESAARVTSTVGHGSTILTNIATGGAAIVALGVFSGGVGWLAIVAYAGWVGTGMGAGMLADKYLIDEDASETIDRGVVHVLLDEGCYQAANASEVSRTDEDDGQVKTGSDSVYIESFPASRIGDATDCDGVIRSGSEHIFYGGAITEASAKPHFGPIMQTVEFLTTVIGLTKKPKNLWDLLNSAASAAGLAHNTGLTDFEIPEGINDARKAARIIQKIIDGVGKLRAP